MVPVGLGAVAALGQAPFGWWWATLLGLTAGLFMILRSSTPKTAAWCGWALALGYFAASLNWLVEPFYVDAARHAWMAPFALFFMSGGLALFWAAAAGGAHRFAPLRWRWLSLVAALIAAELLRARIFTGFPWASPGHVWIDTPLAQLAAVIGASGLGALTFLWAGLLAQSVQSRKMRRLSFGAALIGTGVIAVISAMILVPSDLPPDRDQTVRLIQPNAPQHLKWHPDHAADYVARQLDYTEAPAAVPPDLILWPETAVPTLLRWAEDLLPRMADAGQGAPILFGIQRDEGLRYFNSLVLLGPEGDIQASYDKHHLVPFGEYVPYGDLMANLGINAFSAELGHGYSAGPSAQVMDLGELGKVLPLICYEAVFPQDMHAAPERPDWVLHATNDAWFGEFSMPYQHLDIARFRAIEFGLPVIRVANTGVSAVIGPTGEIRQALALGTDGYLDARIPGSRSVTPFARFGDLPLTLLVIATLGAVWRPRQRNCN
ncbi:apolipoprotein N-acyltransferase [Aliiroseovarius crassostreae]|uniref:apolipoprotein N-acyltransferase n=1 Tax=Aliiroseovarius crassostreae TaxID=154981 RepID=UPI003C797726